MQTQVTLKVQDPADWNDRDSAVADRLDTITMEVKWADADALLESLDVQYADARNSIAGTLKARKAAADALTDLLNPTGPGPEAS